MFINTISICIPHPLRMLYPSGQLMIPLSCGATIVLADSGQTHDPLPLFELIKKET
jgi:hypothetical protein